MYKILSFPSEVATVERLIDASNLIAYPPDFEDWFGERRYWYSYLGLAALGLSQNLCAEYNITAKTYYDWNPGQDLTFEYNEALRLRNQRIKKAKQFEKRKLEDKQA